MIRHQISYTDDDGLTWDGIAERAGKVGGRTLYQVILPADPLCGASERVLPMLANGLSGARTMLANYYEDRPGWRGSSGGVNG